MRGVEHQVADLARRRYVTPLIEVLALSVRITENFVINRTTGKGLNFGFTSSFYITFITRECVDRLSKDTSLANP